jgi:hypothetical protein
MRLRRIFALSGRPNPFFGERSDAVGPDIWIENTNAGQQTMPLSISSGLGGTTVRIASQSTINGLAAGDTLNVVYWDDAAGQVAVGQFTISSVDSLAIGALSVDTSSGNLSHGDSSGGVFYNGELVGNMGAIVNGGHIALVPPSVTTGSKAGNIIR